MEANLRSATTSLISELRGTLEEVRQLWRSRESVDASVLMLDVLAFRNFDVFDSVVVLVESNRLPTAEMLLRPLLEGTVIFEWCMVEPKSRALRFRRTSFENTLELIDLGFLKQPPEYVRDLRDSIAWFESLGHKRLPNMRQMLDDVPTFRPGVGYLVYKSLSQTVHGLSENWQDHVDLEENTFGQSSGGDKSPRYFNCLAIAGFLALRNIALLGNFDPHLRIARLRSLEDLWAQVYKCFEKYEGATASKDEGNCR